MNRVTKMTGMGSSSTLDGGKSMTSKGSKGKRKPKFDPLSLEDVFNQTTTVTAANVNPAPSRVVLTPRSAEVVLKLGINPEVLKIRDIDSFWESGIEPSVQRMRHEAYVQRRYEVMKQCRLERKRIMNAEFEAATTIQPTDGLTPEQILEQQKEASSSLVKLEMARIAKMQARQEKELSQMIAYEVERAKVASDMEKRLAEAKRKDELRKKQMEKRLKLAGEERRLRELQKAAQEEIEEENRKQVAHDMHEKELQLKHAADARAKSEKARRRQMEIEKKEKLAAQKAKVQQFFSDEQQRLRAGLETLHLAEEKKQAAMAKKQQELAQQLLEKRAMVEKRIEENMKIASMIETKRKTDFEKKQDEFEEKRLEHLRKQEEERNLASQELMLQEQRRRMILIQKRKEEEKKAESMLEKFEEEEIHVMEVKEQRMRSHELLKERKKLRTQMKLENVQRVHRVNEYKRMNTLKKIEDVDGRVEKMLKMKEELVADRRKAAQATKLKKEKIASVMEEVRTNATKAQKLITQAMSGSVTLASLTADKTKKKRKKKSQSTSDLLGLTGESDGFGASGGMATMPARSYADPNDGDTKPYISPYDGDETVDL